jgi:hypothetical protein
MPYESSTSKQPYRVDWSDREPHTPATAGICEQDTERRRFPWVSFVIDCPAVDDAIALAAEVPRSPGLVAELRPIPDV